MPGKKTTDTSNVVPMTEPQPAPEQTASEQQAPTATQESAPAVGIVAQDFSVEAVLALQRKLNEQREGAIQTLIRQREEISKQLELLGHTEEVPFSARGPKKAPAAKAPSSGGSSVRPEAFCRYCQINGHDARLHRGQATKKKFTPAELASLQGKG